MMRIRPGVLCLALFFSAFAMQAQQGSSMARNPDADDSEPLGRIAIAAVGDSVASEISRVAGRSPYYLVFDRDGAFFKAIRNSARTRVGGASSRVVGFLKKESVETLIAGKFGDKMQSQLKANGMEYHERSGTAKKAVEAFVKKKRCEQAQD